MTDPTSITVPRPHVPYGPIGVDTNRADAAYLREAAHNIEFSRCLGSNLTQVVTRLLADAAAAIEEASRGE